MPSNGFASAGWIADAALPVPTSGLRSAAKASDEMPLAGTGTQFGSALPRAAAWPRRSADTSTSNAWADCVGRPIAFRSKGSSSSSVWSTCIPVSGGAADTIARPWYSVHSGRFHSRLVSRQIGQRRRVLSRVQRRDERLGRRSRVVPLAPLTRHSAQRFGEIRIPENGARRERLLVRKVQCGTPSETASSCFGRPR